MTPHVTRRGAGIFGAVLGVAAAGVAAGVATERYLLRRSRGVVDPHVDEPFGELPCTRQEAIVNGRGLDIHVEVVEPGAEDDLTVVFVHGFCLDMGTFHFQRTGFDGQYRMVFYDQPGHGKSGHLTDGDYAIEDLADTLAMVIERVAPKGRLILVGHSMGGMTIMALAERHPDLMAKRVRGVALISTSSGQMHNVSFGMPQIVTQVRGPLLPVVRATGPVASGVVDKARQVTSEFVWLLTRKYGFGGQDPSPALISYVERMNSSTSLEVISRYLKTIHTHDRRAALEKLRSVPVVVICGDRDLITPLAHSMVIAGVLPTARMEVVPEGGHVALLEHSERVNEILADFFSTLAATTRRTVSKGRGRRQKKNVER